MKKKKHSHSLRDLKIEELEEEEISEEIKELETEYEI